MLGGTIVHYCTASGFLSTPHLIRVYFGFESAGLSFGDHWARPLLDPSLAPSASATIQIPGFRAAIRWSVGRELIDLLDLLDLLNLLDLLDLRISDLTSNKPVPAGNHKEVGSRYQKPESKLEIRSGIQKSLVIL